MAAMKLSTVCQRCIRRQGALPRTFATAAVRAQEKKERGPGQKEKGQKAWQEQARDIETGARPSMLSLLEERGFVKQVAGGRDALDWLLTRKPVGAYVGVDPTAPSMHVGHLLPLMALYWLHLHGYRTVTLVSGLRTGTEA
jgi:tyrosyl-tRNA synthetase